MHDAGTRNVAHLRHMMQQCVEQRAFPVTGSGMHHHAGRLIHHQDMVILKHDIDIDILRLECITFGQYLRNDLQLFAAPHLGLGGYAVTGYVACRHGDKTFLDPALQARTGMFRHQLL